MAAAAAASRLLQAPLHAIIRNNLLRPSLAAGASTKLFDIAAAAADAQLPIPNSASSKPLIGAVVQPAWKLPFGLPVIENSRIEVRGRVVTPDEERDDDEDHDEDFDDGDVNDIEGRDDGDFRDGSDYEDSDDSDD